MKHLFSIALMLFCFVAVAQASPMIEADQNTYELTVEHPEDVLMVTDQEVTINDVKPLAYVNDVAIRPNKRVANLPRLIASIILVFETPSIICQGS